MVERRLPSTTSHRIAASATSMCKATLTDFDGDATSTVSPVALQIEFQDDGIIAKADIDSVTEDIQPVATGNVLTGNYVGATPNDTNTDDGVADKLGTDGLGSLTWVGAAANVVNGLYGKLSVDANGNYVYTLYTQAENPAGHAAVQALDVGQHLTEMFDYIATDGDGDQARSTLTITITGSDDTASVVTAQATGADATVFEIGSEP